MNRPFIPRKGTLVYKIPEHEQEYAISNYYLNLMVESKSMAEIMKNLPLNLPNDIDNFIWEYWILFEQKRIDIWLPFCKRLGIPYRPGFNTSPTLDGHLFIEIDTVPWEHMENYYKGEGKVDNIYDNRPVDGKIIGKLTEEELDALLDIEAITNAIANTSIECSNVDEFQKFLEKYKEIERDRVKTWMKICKRFNVPMQWDLRADFSTGFLFSVNYDKPYGEQDEI